MKLLRGVLIALLFVGAVGGTLFLLARPVKTPLNYYDEGLVLLNATNVLNGDVPYKDFWTIYSPGYYYMLAFVFKVLGATVLVARIFDLVQRAILALAIYLTARRFAPGLLSLLPFAFAVLWLGSIRFYSYPVLPALMYTLLAYLCLFRFFDNRRARWLILSGVAAGLTATIRHDLGAFAVVGLGLGLLVHEMGGRESTLRSGARRQSPIASLLLFFAGIAAIAVPFYLYLIVAGDLRAMWNDLIVFPASVFRAYRDLPKPGLVPDLMGSSHEGLEDWVRFYLPLLVYACAVLVVLAAFIKHRTRNLAWPAKGYSQIIALTATGLLLFNQAMGRYEALHVLPAQLLALLTATALLARVPAATWKRPWVFLWIPVIVPAILWPAYIAHYIDAYQEVKNYDPRQSYSSLPRSGGVPLEKGEQMAVEYIQQNTTPNDHIFVGNTHHDLIVVNDLGFYFLANRRSPTIYQELHPGVATTLAVQEEIVEHIRKGGVEYIVRVDVWEPREPNQSAVSSGVTYLDDFIRGNYTLCFERGNYYIYRRR